MAHNKTKIILSGGGTGGHIYPAVAVAEALKRRLGDGVEVLFVGAEGKMEMEKIPALGYDIKGLPVAGLQRSLNPRNLLLPFKVAKSIRMAKGIIRDFGADMVVGFGGYASAPVLKAAQRMGVPTLIQEQNSYAGLTNKMLAKKARTICVAYDGMERFFPAEKIVMTGNPLRGNFSGKADRGKALEYFGFTPDKPVIMVVGGSLGSRTFNNMMKAWAEKIVEEKQVQVIWQTGKYYEKEMDQFMEEKFPGVGVSSKVPACKAREEMNAERTDAYVRISTTSATPQTGGFHENIWRGAFIERMDYAYAATDLVISRSGAITVSELCLLGKPVMFVPSPNVSEDHQTKNAMALVEKGAAEICPDTEAVERAMPTAMEFVRDKERLASLSANIRKLGIPDSAERVAEIIMNQ